MTRSTSLRARRCRARSSSSPSTCEVAEVGAQLLRLGVDEADEVDAVLRMLEQLAGDQLADVPGADDRRVFWTYADAARDARARASRIGDDGERWQQPERRAASPGSGATSPTSHDVA